MDRVTKGLTFVSVYISYRSWSGHVSCRNRRTQAFTLRKFLVCQRNRGIFHHSVAHY